MGGSRGYWGVDQPGGAGGGYYEPGRCFPSPCSPPLYPPGLPCHVWGLDSCSDLGSSLWVGWGACALPSAGSRCRCGGPSPYPPYHTHRAAVLLRISWLVPFLDSGLVLFPVYSRVLGAHAPAGSVTGRGLAGSCWDWGTIQSTGGGAWLWPNTPAPAVIQPVTGCGHSLILSKC